MPERRQIVAEVVTVAAFCAFLFYFGLGAFGLVGADEPRYAQIAREMLARRDVVTPTLYGHPWLEKPPLYYWRAMESYAILGVKDWVARLPSATAATFLIFAVYLFARYVRRGSELNAALITASSAGVIGFARGAGPDMMLAASFAVAMLCWWTWQESTPRTQEAVPAPWWRWPQVWLALFYVVLALGTLAKGPVAPFLAAVVLALYAAARRDLKVATRTLWAPGIVLFLVIAAPWYVAVQIKNPSFVREFLLQHNLERFATNRYHHPQPFWYYLPIYLVGLLPWSGLFVAALVSRIGTWRERRRAAAESERLPVFLVIWLAVVVVFFSFSESKLPGYVLPAIPAGTLLASEWLHGRERLGWPLTVTQGVLSGALVALALLFPSLAVHRHDALPAGATLFAGLVALGIFLATVGTLWRQPIRVLRFVVLAPLIIALAFLLRVGGPVIDSLKSARPVAGEITQIERGQSQVAVFRASREVEYGLGFYRNHGIPRYERGEMPATDHLVVVPEQYQDALLKAVRPRRASHVGGFAPQHLEFYWISPPMPEHPHH